MSIERTDWKLKVKAYNPSVDIKTSGGYTYEQVMGNKNVSKDPKYWHQIKGTDRFLFKSKVAESWEFYDPWIENPIRNTNQVYLRFLDISSFIEAANYHKRFGTYTNQLEGTMSYDAHWEKEERKCETGIWDEGVYLTGRHYFTINYGRFRARATDADGRILNNRKILTFLGFLDHQYYIFHELEECMLDGQFSRLDTFLENFPLAEEDDFELLSMESFVVVKGRRKGWTAIISAGVLYYNFCWRDSSNQLIVAGLKDHYGPMTTGIRSTKNWVDKETPFIRRTELKNRQDHMQASFRDEDEYGRPIIEGYFSEMKFASFKDNDFKGIGDTADVINVEEPGKFENLLEAHPISLEPLVRDGEIRTGVIIAGGTAGDMEAGGSQALFTIMHDPEVFGAKEYTNIYEEDPVPGVSGWFIDDLWYSPSKLSRKALLELEDSERVRHYLSKTKESLIQAVDKQGNSYRFIADLVLQEKRRKNRKAPAHVFNKFVTQQPRYLSDAFLVNESSPFDVATAREVLADLKINEGKILREKGHFYLTKEGIKWSIDLKANEINEYPWEKDNQEGCWVIYEHPKKIEVQDLRNPEEKNTREEIPRNRYIAGTDPTDWGSDEVGSTDNRRSFACTYILDTLTRNIVAVYISRPHKANDYFEQLWRGLEYFNAILLYENNLKSLYSYFQFKNKSYLLAVEPDSLRGKIEKNRQARVKGFHATPAINSYAREQLNIWSLEQVQVGQDPKTGEGRFLPRMFFIKDTGLLQEMIKWNSKGNFDRISGIGAAMILLFDRTYQYEEDNGNTRVSNRLYTGIFKRVKKYTHKKRLNKYQHETWRQV